MTAIARRTVAEVITVIFITTMVLLYIYIYIYVCICNIHY